MKDVLRTRFTKNAILTWCVAGYPFLAIFMRNIIPLSNIMWIAIGLGLTIGLIDTEMNKMKEYGCCFSKKEFIAFLIIPAYYLLVRAIKTDRKFLPAVIRVAAGVLAIIILLSSCSSAGISEEKIEAIAIALNEEINFLGKTDSKYNLQYSDFYYETDGYNRYIVSLHYQYEDSSRHYQNGDIIVYFQYNPDEGSYTYKKTNVAFPNEFIGEEKWFAHIKEKEDFGWGEKP